MQRVFLVLILAWTAFPASAAKRMTVAQLEEQLKAATAAHKRDEEIARRITEAELSERLTDVSLDRLTKEAAQFPQSAQALQLLADQSAFLDPPPGELPATTALDAPSQQQVLNAARIYAGQVLPRLPDFLGTRTISRYDDSPWAAKKGDWGVRQGLRLVDTSSQEISVSMERENQPPAESSAVWKAQIGLISGGEFGTTLEMIMTDTAQGRVSWDHWEATAAGQMAVFQYSVPRSASHFQVIGFKERTDRVGLGSVTRGSAPPKSGVLPGDPSNTAIIHTKPGYHGSMWIDPATGTIFRITLEADSKEGLPLKRGGILVQYGPVQIGDRSFICPTQSLAFSAAVPDPQALMSDAPTEWLNVTRFTGYHHFAATTRILADTPAAQPEKPGSDAPQTAGHVADETPAVRPQPDATPIASPEPVAPSIVVGQTLARSALAVSFFALNPPPAPIAPPAASPPVSRAAPANVPATTGVTIEMKVDRVLVPVVVRDKNGLAVAGLTQEDFKVFDNDKARSISGFEVEKRAGIESSQASDRGIRQDSQGTPESVLPNRVIVFVFDDLHLSFEDVSYAQKAASKTLDTLDNADLAAVVSTSGKINTGLTHDAAKLRQGLMALQPQGTYRTDASECPKIDYYQADLIENERDNGALQDAIRQVMWVCNPNLPLNLAEAIARASARRALTLGSQDVRASYAAISEYVRRIARMPGQHLVILVSSGFLPIEQEARTLESRLINLAAQSNVAISAIDARGLYTASMMANDDLRGRVPDQVADYRRASMKLAEDSMGELADGTGGDFFHSNNDLDAGFRSLTRTPETVYVLELSLDNVRMDGTYHRLKVKLDRDGLDVNARRGYFMPKADENKK